MLLNLGTVKDLASVRLNGRDLGLVWCAPWQINVTGVLKPAGNQLEIAVVNTWRNRMIGDEQFPLDYLRNTDGTVKNLPPWLTAATPRTSGRFTFTTMSPFKKGDALSPAGLLGPVTVRALVSPSKGTL
jgi:hypothetical protein